MQNRIQLGLLITILALLEAGCTASVETRVALVRPAPKALSFKFVDKRPVDERVVHIESGVKALGDGNFESPPADYIAATLEEKLGDRLVGREVTLDGLASYYLAFYGPVPMFVPMPAGTSPLAAVAAGLLPVPPDRQVAHIDLHGHVDQLRFSGGNSVSFKFGSGSGEMREAFEGAMRDVVHNLQAALDAEARGDTQPAGQ